MAAGAKPRLHFLFTGYLKVKWDFIGHDVPMEQAFAFHNHPVHLPVLLISMRWASSRPWWTAST